MKRDKKGLHRENYSNSEDDSSSSEDDENAELWTEELEEGFFKVLSRLKKKDAKLYEKSVKYFPNNTSEAELDLRTGETDKKSLEEYRDWLKGQKEKVENKEVVKELKALHDFWTSPTLSKDEQFLRDYILNEKFLERDNSFNIEEAVNNLSDEEREVEEQLRYEHQYNCRFENPDQGEVVKNKSKTKRKSYTNGKEVSVDENKDSLHHSVSAKVGSSVEGSKNRKKKNKKNKELVEKIVLKERDEETSTENPVKNLDVPQLNTSSPKGNKKSRKRKRKNSEQKILENTASNVSCDQSKTDMVCPKKKSKKKKCFTKMESNAMEEIRPIVLTTNKQKRLNNLPRNLQMKNEKGKKKERHRNMRKALLKKKNNKGAKQIGGTMTDLKVGLKVNKVDKNVTVGNNFNKNVNDAKKHNNFQKKKVTHFHNSIMKEKKNKEFKFSKMLSKKQKAARAAGKS